MFSIIFKIRNFMYTQNLSMYNIQNTSEKFELILISGVNFKQSYVNFFSSF